MLKEFEYFIEKNNLCTKRDSILLTVSGGLDSMVMVHLFLRGEFQVSVAHANFQLRGVESDRDEEFVKNYCNQLLIPFFSKRFDTSSFARENHVSIQMAARALRYRWFQQLGEERGFKAIATAHHRSDFAETVLHNLVHHQGLRGLAGIPIRNQNVIRPLLFATRSQLETYAADYTIVWREDESNSSVNYERNKIRHAVIPTLKEINPSLEETLFEVGKMALGDLELVELGLAGWRKMYMAADGENLLISKKGLQLVENPALLLFRVLEPLNFNYVQCESVILSLHSQPGKLFHSDSHQLVVDRENLLLGPKKTRLDSVLISEADTESANGKMKLSLSRKSSHSIEADVMKAFLDADKIRFPLTWRPWRNGDSFHPLGMDQRKKVSDFLIDQKISVIDKEKVTVLESAGEIVWLIGYRIDHRFRITSETREVISFVVDAFK